MGDLFEIGLFFRIFVMFFYLKKIIYHEGFQII